MSQWKCCILDECSILSFMKVLVSLSFAFQVGPFEISWNAKKCIKGIEGKRQTHRITNKVLKCWSKIHKFPTRQNGKNNVRNNLRLARIDRCRTFKRFELVAFRLTKKKNHQQEQLQQQQPAMMTAKAQANSTFCCSWCGYCYCFVYMRETVCVTEWASVYLQLLSNCKVERQNNKQQMQKPVNGVKWKTLSIFKFWIACSQFSFSRKLSSCFWQHGPMDWKFFESEIKPTAKFSCEYVLFIRASIKLWHSDYPIAYHLSWFFLSPSIHNAHVFALPQQFWAISKKQVVCQNCVNN